ncbi:hypothetical protein FMM01_02060 [Schleiferilactobacillus harbinensis]|uniref:hypothetical protein n=1 Tax=Schleiferilactobacillus harbinensis TaxID=304207 RepID=UPI0012399445|nr:hypothetical protein [Schleiferilactobacillus harbinensis]QEU46199.1 hypothetical protein FMM01_02060 [Schleiferilactobacillus harbinensis]
MSKETRQAAEIQEYFLLVRSQPDESEQEPVVELGELAKKYAAEDPDTVQELLHEQIIEHFLQSMEPETTFRLMALYYVGVLRPRTLEEATQEYKAQFQEWKEHGQKAVANQLSGKISPDRLIIEGAKRLHQEL